MLSSEMKRPSEHDLEASDPAEKKRRNAHNKHFLRNRQRGADAIPSRPQDTVLIDHQLNKGICLALHAAGFSSVTREALSGFHDLVQEYMHHFSLRVHESMRSCRRSKPVPTDFIHALAQFDLTPSGLAPDLKLEPPTEITQAPISQPASSATSAFDLDPFIPRNELSHTTREQIQHIPKHFPIFPSRHSYIATPVFATREHDALKIRERATHEGSQAEQALRNLMIANKATERNLKYKKGGHQGKEQIEREEIWKQALDAMGEEETARMKADEDRIMFGYDGAEDTNKDAVENTELDTGVAGYANYDRMFWRRKQRKEIMRVG